MEKRKRHAGPALDRERAPGDGAPRRRGRPPRKAQDGSPHQDSAPGWDALTPAQLRVVRLVLEGKSNPEIGEALEISRRTVSSHLSTVFRKLRVRSRIDLILRAHELENGSRGS